MQSALHKLLLASALTLTLAAPAWSAGFMDNLKSQAAESLGGGTSASTDAVSGLGALGGAGGLASTLGLPSLSSGSAGNAAGVLQYCIQNKYLAATDADNIKDKLLDKAGLGQQQEKDPGYQQGLAGLLSGGDGSSFDFSKIQDEIKDKACDYVLDQAGALL